MAQTILKTDDSGNDERAELRRAIASAKEAREALAAHEAATAKARELVEAADMKFDRATAELAEAKDKHAKAIAAHASGAKSPAAGSAIRAAREAVEAAEDEHEGAVAALKQLEGEHPGFEVAEWQSRAHVEVSIAGLLAGPARDLLQKVTQLENDLLLHRRVLTVLIEDPGILRHSPGDTHTFAFHRDRDRAFAPEVRAAIRHLLNVDVDFRQHDPAVLAKAKETAAQWRQTIAALRSNPDTALPD